MVRAREMENQIENENIQVENFSRHDSFKLSFLLLGNRREFIERFFSWFFGLCSFLE